MSICLKKNTTTFKNLTHNSTYMDTSSSSSSSTKHNALTLNSQSYVYHKCHNLRQLYIMSHICNGDSLTPPCWEPCQTNMNSARSSGGIIIWQFLPLFLPKGTNKNKRLFYFWAFMGTAEFGLSYHLWFFFMFVPFWIRSLTGCMYEFDDATRW